MAVTLPRMTLKQFPKLPEGVQVSLLLNPRTRAFRSGGNEATYSRTARIDLTAVIPGFHLDLSELFSWFRARPE